MQNNQRIIDTTLREGEQTPGVTFTLSDKMRIVDGLAAIGVAEVEVGIASPLVRDIDTLLAYCRDRHPRLPLSLWSRCRRDDITLAGRLRPDVLSLSMPVSDLHLGPRLGKDRHWARRQMNESIAMALDTGLQVSVGFEDATRADTGFLAEMAGLADQAGAGRLRLADTVGLCSPGRISGLIANMLAAGVHCDLAVHTHNDFGMATANAVAALEAGAGWADATVLGLGERAGCARLEELVGYLRLVKGETGLAPEHLRGLAEYVAARSACPVDPGRPLIGDRIFTCETGLHLQGLQRDPATYEPYPPEQVGAERRLLFGAKCGRRALIDRLRRLGHCPDEGQVNRRIASFRDRALSVKTSLTDADLLAALG